MEDDFAPLNTADQSVWADSRASTPILYVPDFLPTPTEFNWRRSLSHSICILLLLYGISHVKG